MGRKLVAVIVLVLALSGCGDFESDAEQNLRLGIECREAGGEWKLVNPSAQYDSFKDNQFCEFKQKEK